MIFTWGSLNLTATPYLVEFGFDPGAPENEAVALPFLLQDGEIELSSRASNRTLQFNVLIEGASLTVLATAEAALMAESEKVLNTITVNPEDGAPVAVYEVFRGQVTLARDDEFERSRLRRYTVTVRAYPSVRSAAEVTAAALAATGTTTTPVNDGSATTNWTGSVSAGVLTGPTVVSGAVKVGTTAAILGACTVASTYTASITTSSTKYLVIDWKPEAPAGVSPLRAYGDATQLTQVAQTVSPTAGFTRTWFYVAAASIAVLRIESTSTVPDYRPAMVRSLYVDNIDRTDVKPSFGTGRQLMRSIDVAGSARSAGSIAIEHGTSALGDVFAYFFPDTEQFAAYSPPLRQYRVAGGATVTSDATMCSGSRDQILAATSTYDIPVANLVFGLYTLMIRLLAAGGAAATITWTANTYVNATAVGTTQTGTFTTGISASYINSAIARIVLPTVDVDPAATNAVVRLTLTAAGAGVTNAYLDEAWFFNSDIGQLVAVACGTGAAASGGPAKRVFLEPPTLTAPRPTVRIGHASDRSDSFYPTTVTAWEFPQFVPPRVRVLTVTSNATDASVTLRHYPRWHTNPAS